MSRAVSHPNTEVTNAHKPRGRGAHGSAKWVYDFNEGSRDLRDLLGGKGAGIAEMTRVLGT